MIAKQVMSMLFPSAVRLAPPPLSSKGQATIRRRRKGKEKGNPQAEKETEKETEKLDQVSKPAVGNEVFDRSLDENESQALTVVDTSRFKADEGDTITGRCVYLLKQNSL